MVTKSQALTTHHFHFNGCTRTYGPRGGITERVSSARRKGATQTWKTRPDDFRIPVKVGFRGYDAITNFNAEQWHTTLECPLNAPCVVTEPHVCHGGASHTI